MLIFNKDRNEVNTDYAVFTISHNQDGCFIDTKQVAVILAWFDLHCESVEIKYSSSTLLVVEVVHPFNSHLVEPFGELLKTLELS